MKTKQKPRFTKVAPPNQGQKTEKKKIHSTATALEGPKIVIKYSFEI